MGIAGSIGSENLPAFALPLPIKSIDVLYRDDSIELSLRFNDVLSEFLDDSCVNHIGILLDLQFRFAVLAGDEAGGFWNL